MKVVLTVVLVIIVLIVAGSAYVSAMSRPPNSINILRVTVSFSPSSIYQGESLAINFELYNPYPIPLTLYPNSNIPKIQGFLYPADPVLCGYSAPYGYAVLRGYYGMSNYSDGKPLIIFKPVFEIINCPEMGLLHAYDMYPLSDVITIVGSNGRTFSDQYSVTINGTWFVNGSDIANLSTLNQAYAYSNSNSSTFEYFAPGVYTVIAGDEWGDIHIPHFTVD